MNRLMQEKWPWIEGSNDMRTGLLDVLSDADLAFNPGGQNKTLGALFREMGEIEHSYAQSFKTFKQDWDYRHDAAIESSVAKLKAWFAEMDTAMKDTLDAFSDDDLKRTIVRPSGFDTPIEMQVDIYLQALLMFFGKVTIFLRAMNKPLPPSLQEWVW